MFGEFLRKYGLFNAHILLDGDKLTPEIAKLITRYSLNVMIPLECTETGHQSIKAIEKRNPGFEALLGSLPPSKVEILFTTKMDTNPNSLIVLALNFPHHDILVRRHPENICSFFDVQSVVNVFSTQDTTINNIDWIYDLSRNFTPVDYGALKELGLVGEQECLVMSK